MPLSAKVYYNHIFSFVKAEVKSEIRFRISDFRYFLPAGSHAEPILCFCVANHGVKALPCLLYNLVL